MKKALTSLLMVTLAVVLSFVLVTGPQAAEELTILETLCSQDGTQVLCAAIKVAEERCPRFARLLNRTRVNLTMLAPTNEGFEVYLNLSPGIFEGWSVDAIVGVLPGLIEVNGMRPRSLCQLLRRHISKGVRWDDPITLEELRQQGSITMMDGAEYPVSYGGGRGGGVCVNYESCITERDVYTQNGVIHYLHNVLQRAPVEEPPQIPPEPEDEEPEDEGAIDAWCSQGACAEDEVMQQECIDFLGPCLASSEKEGDREGCAASALFKCTERDGLFGGDGLFDDDGIFD